MPKLPDRYGAAAQQKFAEDENIVSDNFIVTTSMLSGACALAVMAQSMVLKRDFLYDFIVYGLQAVDPGSNYFQLAITFSMVSGFLTFAVALVLGFFALSNDIPKMRFLITLLSLFAVIMLGTGATILVIIDVLDNAIEEQASQTSFEASDDRFVSGVSHFQYAIYNICCADKGWTRGGSIDWCAGEEPGFNPSPNAARQDFSWCFSDPIIYTKMNFTISEHKDLICSNLEDITIDISGVNIPGTSVDVAALTGGTTKLALVGPAQEPEYGCGYGVPVAFQVAMFLWFKQTCEPLAYTALVCGILQIVSLLFAGSAVCFGTNGNESSDQAYQRYMREINGATRPQQNFQYTNNAALQAHASNQNRNSIRSGISGVSGYSAVQSNGSSSRNVPVAQVVSNPGGRSAKVFDVDDKI